MIKTITKYIVFILIYIYTHIFFILLINIFFFKIKVEYKSDINLTYENILKYKNYILSDEKTFYKSFDTKKIIIKTKEPIIEINNLIFFNYQLGIPKEKYLLKKTIPIIHSKIPFNQMNEFLIKLIHKQYINLQIISKKNPLITIIDKKMINIQTDDATFIVQPFIDISKYDYAKIIKEKISYFKKDHNLKKD